jgi:hypothetical protein
MRPSAEPLSVPGNQVARDPAAENQGTSDRGARRPFRGWTSGLILFVIMLCGCIAMLCILVARGHI